MIGQVPLSFYLLLSAILFAIGAGGVLIRRNVIVVLMCVEMMMNAVNLTFIAFSRYLASTGSSPSRMRARRGVGLALLVELNRHKSSVDINEFNSLKG